MLGVTASLGRSATEYRFPASAKTQMERGECEQFDSRIWITGVEISNGFVADKITDFSVFCERFLVATENAGTWKKLWDAAPGIHRLRVDSSYI